MRWDAVTWAALSLLLIAAETMVPGAFMMWMGFAAAVVFLGVLLVPGLSLLTQVTVFVVLSFVFVLVYRRWFRGRGRPSTMPALNRRAEQLIGQLLVLPGGIVDGEGRVQIGDAFWTVSADLDQPPGARVRVIGVDGMRLRVEPA